MPCFIQTALVISSPVVISVWTTVVKQVTLTYIYITVQLARLEQYEKFDAKPRIRCLKHQQITLSIRLPLSCHNSHLASCFQLSHNAANAGHSIYFNTCAGR